jgi:MerR family copper efflux transcriptional regulator
MTSYQIGEITQRLGLSGDTLRYYEKVGLMPRVTRAPSGIRLYSDEDISRLRFIQRAQKMSFTLAEIANLLKMRDHPQQTRNKVRTLTQRKLAEIDIYLTDLRVLRRELRLLLKACTSTTKGCPIIQRIEADGSSHARKRRRAS